MTLLAEEIDENYQLFVKNWLTELNANAQKIRVSLSMRDSYRRISAIQALKVSVVEPNYSTEATAFYAEAQNDALTSHVLASFGAWRPALQALRSCIENTLNAHYYNDHPVELRLWSTTDFRMGFSALHTYFNNHPEVMKAGPDASGLDAIKGEYATLSKAVHASAPTFRMTDPAAKLLLWSDEEARLGMWATRERKVIEGVCMLTCILNQAHLSGAAHPNARAVLGFAIGESRRKKLKMSHIHIDAPS